MKNEFIPNKCKFCGSENVKIESVDTNIGDYFAVQCQCCWAEGPHCVTKEMAVRMWGIVPEDVVIKYSGTTFDKIW